MPKVNKSENSGDVYKGTTRVNLPYTLVHLGAVNATPAQALNQYPENSRDAGATKIWVILEPNRITIIDNGSGMVPYLLPPDQEYYKMFLEEMSSGKPTPGDLRDFVTLVSQRSLQWMMECVGLSAKRQTEGSSIRGMKAIGALAFRSFADEAVWFTRPSAELAKEYWDKDPKAYSRPAYRLIPPTLSQLAQNDITYSLEELSGPLLDPYNQPLQSGTRVEISGIKPGLENSFRPSVLVDFFRSQYGPDIRGGLQFVIIDRITEEGKKISVGREIMVLPSEYKGIPLVDTEVMIKGQSCKAEIYYIPSGKVENPIQLRWKNSDRRNLTDLPMFRDHPWTSGKLTGYVEFPNVPETDAPWNLDKTMPLASNVRNQWEKAVRDIAPLINEGIGKVEERAQERKLQDLASTLSSAVTEAMGEDELFKDLSLGGSAHKSSKGKGGKKAADPNAERVMATVMSEYHRGVEGVTLQLLRDRKLVTEPRKTGKSGHISFGKLPEGRYTIQMVVPEGMAPIDTTSTIFNLTREKPGARILFHLKTGQDRPQERKLPKLRVWPHPWGNIDEPFSIRRLAETGYIEINTEAPALRRAIMERDEDQQLTLGALYTSMGVAQFSVPQGQADTVMLHASRLFANAYRLARQGGKRPHKK